ncbi:hypothetical protein BX600DRAFT_432450 [Xylariales sp. PMI_506]|nr:hypothetical protein BX600DRAFT_432450 [Xylariales sp. PMI_506]
MPLMPLSPPSTNALSEIPKRMQDFRSMGDNMSRDKAAGDQPVGSTVLPACPPTYMYPAFGEYFLYGVWRWRRQIVDIMSRTVLTCVSCQDVLEFRRKAVSGWRILLLACLSSSGVRQLSDHGSKTKKLPAPTDHQDASAAIGIWASSTHRANLLSPNSSE